MPDKCLFIFIDESGNFDFSPKGTKYFVLTAASTLIPLNHREKLNLLRYQLLTDGVNQEYFHATEDTQVVRDKVFELIGNSGSCSDFLIDSVVAQKNKAHPSLYSEFYEKNGRKITRMVGAELYRVVCQTLLQYIFRRFEFSDVNKIVIVLDSPFTAGKGQLILKSLKTHLKKQFNKPFNIYFHQSKADINCQIADYCGWAIYVKHERAEIRPVKEISSKIKSEFQIFKGGVVEHYRYK